MKTSRARRGRICSARGRGSAMGSGWLLLVEGGEEVRSALWGRGDTFGFVSLLGIMYRANNILCSFIQSYVLQNTSPHLYVFSRASRSPSHACGQSPKFSKPGP